MSEIISVEHLAYTYPGIDDGPGVVVFEDMNLTIQEGICYVAFPEDVHMPGRHLDVPNDFVKVVVKLKVN